ncbi:MAG: tRNA (guanosine(46)-N7)-methyltransferase TrmB [Flavobacteriales bacterium]|nr:tRNA (guanosine(46)-N7)-methyltransferase TrmB [Flavobacteriales bacterium]MDG1779368.1 tRNA (guanosine(46)-N7)-methyltransferase TrmB [Flavobacteriales bacterium]MDG2245165.1 tRNA (guanosine(46)-N7)-methyltransferase TrmB [Flavobacteriales bacterium]
MGKGKLKKWNENKTFNHVFEPTLQDIIDGQEFNKGDWHEKVFGNNNPITLELGCGKGEYTVELARKYPERNFIGVDIKGHRFWRGAKTSNEEGMENVAFLRTRLEFINNFFVQDEVDEIWLTFSDPQPKDDKGSKRITGPAFVDRYKKLLKPGSLINVKTDSTLLYEWTRDQYIEKKYNLLIDSDDVYGKLVNDVDEEMQGILNIKTYYEKRWLEEGKKIKFLRIQI